MADETIEPLDRDPELSRAVKTAFGATASTDWHALESRITAAARFRLRARRPAGWRAASRWARIAIPAARAFAPRASVLFPTFRAIPTPGCR